MRGRGAGMAMVTVSAAVALAACTPQAPGETGTGTSSVTASPSATAPSVQPLPQVRDVATGLEAPWSVVFLTDGTPLVSERDTGNVLELAADGTSRVVGTVPDVAHGGEGGLLGLAVRGDVLYAYSTSWGGNRIQRFALTGAAGSLALGEPETVLEGLPSAATHNGGRIAFGPDGMLYATVGDAGTPSRAQDLDSLGGKVLRMTPDGDVPADNPFAGSLVYSLGHRNPQGIGWSPEGTLFVAEFGQNTWDELNVVTPGGNYGWPEVEGAGGDPDYVDPVQQWPTDEASPSGLEIVGGTLYLANLRGERLRAVPLADPSSGEDLLVGQYGRLRTAVAAPDGTLWIVTGNTDGRGDPRPGDDRIVSIPLESL